MCGVALLCLAFAFFISHFPPRGAVKELTLLQDSQSGSAVADGEAESGSAVSRLIIFYDRRRGAAQRTL